MGRCLISSQRLTSLVISTFALVLSSAEHSGFLGGQEPPSNSVHFGSWVSAQFWPFLFLLPVIGNIQTSTL